MTDMVFFLFFLLAEWTDGWNWTVYDLGAFAVYELAPAVYDVFIGTFCNDLDSCTDT